MNVLGLPCMENALDMDCLRVLAGVSKEANRLAWTLRARRGVPLHIHLHVPQRLSGRAAGYVTRLNLYARGELERECASCVCLWMDCRNRPLESTRRVARLLPRLERVTLVVSPLCLARYTDDLTQAFSHVSRMKLTYH